MFGIIKSFFLYLYQEKQSIMDIIVRLNKKIELAWKRQPKNASEAHFRAQEITRLQERLENIKILQKKIK